MKLQTDELLTDIKALIDQARNSSSGFAPSWSHYVFPISIKSTPEHGFYDEWVAQSEREAQ